MKMISDIRQTVSEKLVDLNVETGLNHSLHCVTGRS